MGEFFDYGVQVVKNSRRVTNMMDEGEVVAFFDEYRFAKDYAEYLATIGATAVVFQRSTQVDV